MFNSTRLPRTRDGRRDTGWVFHHRVLRCGQLTLLGGHGPDLSPCESTRTYETVSDVGSKFSLGRLILTVSIRRLTNTSCYTQRVIIPTIEPWTPVRCLCFFKKVLKDGFFWRNCYPMSVPFEVNSDSGLFIMNRESES
jgi:hypothetical protein